jgi:hypothetical protein
LEDAARDRSLPAREWVAGDVPEREDPAQSGHDPSDEGPFITFVDPEDYEETQDEDEENEEPYIEEVLTVALQAESLLLFDGTNWEEAGDGAYTPDDGYFEYFILVENVALPSDQLPFISGSPAAYRRVFRRPKRCKASSCSSLRTNRDPMNAMAFRLISPRHSLMRGTTIMNSRVRRRL